MSSARRILAPLVLFGLYVACGSGSSATAPPETTATPCNGSGLSDSCPSPPAVPPGCTTPKLSLLGPAFLSRNGGLTEDAEIAATATRVDPSTGGVAQVWVATTEPTLHLDPNTGHNCILRKRIRVWTSQNTIAAGTQGDWVEMPVPFQISLPDLPNAPDHWISDPGLAVDSDGYVYLSAVRTDTETDCSTNNSINDMTNTRILLYIAAPGATAFGQPVEISTDPGDVDHPEIAVNPTIPGQLVLYYLHEAASSASSLDKSSDRLLTLQRVAGTSTLQTTTGPQGTVDYVSRCFIEPASCSVIDDHMTNIFVFARPAFSLKGDLFLAFVSGGGFVLQRLNWNSSNQAWTTTAATPPLFQLGNNPVVGDSPVDFLASFPVQGGGGACPESPGCINLAGDPTPGLAVANVGANSNPIVYFTFETDNAPNQSQRLLADNRHVVVGAVDGTTDLSISHWKGPFTIPSAFHASVSMSGPSNVVDVAYMQPLQVPTTSTSTQIQTFVQRLDATHITAVGSPVPIAAIPPKLTDLPSRHGEGGGFTPESLFIGEYAGIATLGADGFAAGAPGVGNSPTGGTTVQASLTLGSQKCDPPSAVAINRLDAFWQCDHCDCGSDGAQTVVGCVPGSVTDPAVVCRTLCGGTACGQSLSCGHAACSAPASGASATLLAAHSCDTSLGPYLASEPSDFADYVASDDGSSSVTLAKAGHIFSTPSPGSVSFNLEESPPAAGRAIEIARINVKPKSFDTGGISIGPITIEPPHHIHDLNLVHGQRVYGVFSDATHFQVPVGAADFFAVGFDGDTASQQFESNTSPIDGTFDPTAGTFTLTLAVGDPTQDGAKASFSGRLSRRPSYDCAAGIAPVFAPLANITLAPCYEGAPVAVPLPQVSDLCTPHDVSISGQIVTMNGVMLTSPIAVKNGLITAPTGSLVIQWTAADANGTTATAEQTVTVQAMPGLFAEGKLEIDNGASVVTPGGAGAAVVNGGTGPGSATDLHNGASSGPIASVPGVTLTGAAVSGSVQSAGGVAEHAGATITGAVISGAPSLPAFPALHLTFPSTSSGDVDVPQGGQVILSAGSYGNVNVRTGATLSLSAGTYYFGTLHVWPDAILNLDTSAGTVNVDVQTSVLYEGQIVNNGPPSRFVLSYVGSQPVLLHAAFSGVVIAPNAMLQMGLPKGSHVGAFFASDIKVMQGAQVQQTPFACTVP